MTAIHGFLGHPSDWRLILPEAITPSWSKALLDLPGEPGSAGLWELADYLNSQSEDEEGTLVGYSMGGRIALHMILRDPERWKRAVIVSASPGLEDPSERETRLEQDRKWAERFLTDDWATLMADWQKQPVFDADPDPQRQESDYSREELASALTRGSVGHQRRLWPMMFEMKRPILWVAGERDQKYEQLARQCVLWNWKFDLAILPEAGHRAPWSNPEGFRKALQEFVNDWQQER